MKYYTDLHVRNFRGFDDILVPSLNHVNVFMGKNNCGKSTLLEALMTLSGMSNPELPGIENAGRGLNIVSPNSFKSFFFDFDINNIPVISANMANGGKREVSIFYKDEAVMDSNLGSLQNFSNVPSENVFSITLKYKYDVNNQVKNGESSLKSDGKTITVQNRDNDIIIPAISIKDSGLINTESYNRLVINKKEDQLLGYLRQIYPDITSVKIINNHVFLDINGFRELAPIEVMGDGVRKFFVIFIEVIRQRNNIILIDEIENGLHFSSYEILWRGIIRLMRDMNQQIFITSHSLETLQCLNKVIKEEEFKDLSDSVNYYTISKTKQNGNKSYMYSSDNFDQAVTNEIETRI